MNLTNISTLKPFGRFCVSLGMIPTSYKESMSYEEQLIWLCRYIETEVIPKYNENVETINELIVLYNQLKEYVDNYFENLDVQEEINNKLDDMAESGELAEIITAYLEVNGVLAFDSISDLEAATNIIEGSSCYILGEVNYNDGKGAFYKIRTKTEADVIDHYNIVETPDNTLVGERLPNYYINEINSNINNIEDDINDINNTISQLYNYDIIVDINGNGDYTSLATAVANANNGDKILVKKGTYNNEVVNCIGKFLYIIGEDKDTTLIQNNLDDYTRPPFNIGKGFIKNLTINQTSNSGNEGSHSYAVHIDNNDLFNNELTFENCNMFSHSSAAVGVGTRNNCKLKFKDCIIDSDSNDSNNLIGSFFIHNAVEVAYQGTNQRCIIENCEIKSTHQSAIHFRYCGSNTNYLFIRFINSSARSSTYGIYNGVVSADSYNGATANIYIENESRGNNIEILNSGKYHVGSNEVNQVGFFNTDNLDNTIKRYINSGSVIAGSNELSIPHLTTPVNVSIYIKNANVWFPALVHSSDNVNIISYYINNSTDKLIIDSTISGAIVYIIDYV